MPPPVTVERRLCWPWILLAFFVGAGADRLAVWLSDPEEPASLRNITPEGVLAFLRLCGVNPSDVTISERRGSYQAMDDSVRIGFDRSVPYGRFLIRGDQKSIHAIRAVLSAIRDAEN